MSLQRNSPLPSGRHLLANSARCGVPRAEGITFGGICEECGCDEKSVSFPHRPLKAAAVRSTANNFHVEETIVSFVLGERTCRTYHSLPPRRGYRTCSISRVGGRGRSWCPMFPLKVGTR